MMAEEAKAVAGSFPSSQFDYLLLLVVHTHY